ncbi:hypothetical protein QIS74_06264 [Colletotrichum tabaci]|uniref:Integral membrane protein n=1 Tax=Colletotrichum tabaci TaxID=1209068 RepID=A0AAV9TCP8_9PEZI
MYYSFEGLNLDYDRSDAVSAQSNPTTIRSTVTWWDKKVIWQRDMWSSCWNMYLFLTISLAFAVAHHPYYQSRHTLAIRTNGSISRGTRVWGRPASRRDSRAMKLRYGIPIRKGSESNGPRLQPRPTVPVFGFGIEGQQVDQVYHAGS